MTQPPIYLFNVRRVKKQIKPFPLSSRLSHAIVDASTECYKGHNLNTYIFSVTQSRRSLDMAELLAPCVSIFINFERNKLLKRHQQKDVKLVEQ